MQDQNVILWLEDVGYYTVYMFMSDDSKNEHPLPVSASHLSSNSCHIHSIIPPLPSGFVAYVDGSEV
jgi:hypothetical protein